jgi:hypothetical protein
MKKVAEVKKVEDVKTPKETHLSESEVSSLEVLIQAVQMATKVGAFSIEDAVVVGTAKQNLEYLIKKQ